MGGEEDDGGMEREREREGVEMEREFLPSPKATECALMHCGREHTVSPERERESSDTPTHTHTHHAEFSHYHNTAF